MACYIRNNLSYNVRENFSNDIENIFLDIMLPKTKPILIGVVYRPPDKSHFVGLFSEALVTLSALTTRKFTFWEIST